MILGIDLGNFATKTSEGVKFKSTVKLGHEAVNNNDIKVIFNGKKYTVGSDNGALNLGKDKINKEHYIICLLTAIAKSSNEKFIEADIVVGLPPELFNSDLKEALEEKLNKIGKQNIIIGQEEKTIILKKAEVFSECAIPFSNPSKYENSKSLWIDIGGGSCDIYQFDGLEASNHTTTEFGMLTLYGNMKKVVNQKYSTKYSEDDMEDMLNKDSYKIFGEMKDISFLNDSVNEHTQKIFNVIHQQFDPSREMYLIGGGAEPLIKVFKKEFNHISLEKNAQFLNAHLYKKVGEMIFND